MACNPGYSTANTKLIVDESEAERVRDIFNLYLERQSLLAVIKELHRRDWRTKRWITKKKTTRGGRRLIKAHSMIC